MSVTFGFTADQLIQEGRVKKEEINQIKSWLASEEVAELTDEQIVVFLLSCCNDLENTKTAILACIELIRQAPEITTNRSLEREDLQQHLQVGELFVSPERTDEGYAIIFTRLQDTDYRKMEIEPTIILMSMTLEAALYDYPPTGLIIVNDMKGMSFMHMTKMNIRLAKMCMKFLQTALPLQLKQVHVINTPYFIDNIMVLCKPFMSQKVLDLIHIHSPNTDMDMFSDTWIPKRYLPQDYGGDLPSCSTLHQRNIEKLQQMKPYFDATELQRCRLSQEYLGKN